MGKSPFCDNIGEGLKRGPWTPEEDQKLLAYIQQHGHGSWRFLPQKAGQLSTYTHIYIYKPFMIMMYIQYVWLML